MPQAGEAEVEARGRSRAHAPSRRPLAAHDRAPSAPAILLKAADLIEARAEEIARLDALESGKPIAQARGEIAGAVDIWRYAAALARDLHGESYANLGDAMLGVVCASRSASSPIITPWNFPFLIVSQKLPFALAAGCTAVVKPSEMTSASTLRARRDPARGGRARRRGQHRRRPRRRSRRAAGRPPAGRDGLVHRLDPRRQADHGGGGADAEEGLDGARRQERPDRLPRCRSGGRRRRRGVRRLLQCRRMLQCRQPPDRAARRSRTSSSAAGEGAAARVEVGDPLDDAPRSARSSRAEHLAKIERVRRRGADRRGRVGACGGRSCLEAPAIISRRPSSAASPRTWPSPARRCSARCSRC